MVLCVKLVVAMSLIKSRISCMEILVILVTIIVTGTLKPADALRGFDCGGVIGSLRTISRLDYKCNIKDDEVTTRSRKIALLRLNDYQSTDIIQCNIIVKRTVTYCGMPSNNSIENGGFAEYMYPITREMCETAHKNGTVEIGNITIDNLSKNNGKEVSVTFAGSVNSKGSCDGVYFSDPYGSWDNVIAEGSVLVTLRKKTVTNLVDSNKIIVSPNDKCKLSDGYCITSDGKYTFWDGLPGTNCTTDTYSLLFKGKATEFVTEKEAAISVNINDTSYTLSIGEPEKSCGVSVFKTGHPRIFMVKLKDFNLLFNKGIVSLKEDYLEIFRYTHSERIYVTRSSESQMKSLYRKMMEHECQIEKEIFIKTVSLADTEPDQFAYQYLQAPGFMAVVAGEAIHVVECVQAVVQVRHTDKCYNRLPITSGNRSLFLTPVTHIITEYASEIPCVKSLMEQYKLDGAWIGHLPLVTEDQMSLTFEKPAALEQLRMYKKKELEEIRSRIMFPIDTNIAIMTMVQEITNGMDSDSIKDLIHENMMQELAEDTWSRSWEKFCSTCAGLIAIYVSETTILMIIDNLISTWDLFSTYRVFIYITIILRRTIILSVGLWVCVEAEERM